MDSRAHRTDTGIADVLLGASAGAWDLVWWASRPFRVATGVVLRGVVAAPGGRAPAQVTSALAERGRRARADLERAAEAVLQLVALRILNSGVVDSVVAALDLTALVRRHVDLDALAAELDVDAVVARVDLDAAIERVDVDAIAARVDLDTAAERLDLDAIAARIDLDAAIDRVDLDAIAARIDPDLLVAKVDFEAALARIDLLGIARDVIDAIGLPEIVRDSTGHLASEAVRSVRAEGMHADDAVAGFVDRLLRRRRAGTPVSP